MNRRHVIVPAIAFVVLGCATVAPALAQGGTARPLAIGIGVGLVDQGNDEEPYFTANFRFPLKRGGGGGKSAYRAYLEPEIGFWDSSEPFGSDDLLEAEMTNVGINFLALARGRRIETWVGIGVGAYFEDVTVRGGGVGVVFDASETNLGGNLQVGLDINIGRAVAIFGMARIDFIDSEFFDDQQKLVIGLRFRFGG